ncbi:MAG TPA: pilus assembly PilX N-terminal domain-containing protein [Thermoanaerobaculia bacterium]|nr:pilus assembly PilX N-terminal domain-containing protein [Thermoanaerobaculia bacterium]
MRKSLHHLGGRVRQRGSALLVSLMVMTGLSLLGLAFVAMTETENSISLNERNHAQTVAIAEAGARLVVQWFQDPATMLARGLMPKNVNQIKTSRTVGDSYTGYYKPGGNLCDTPYGPSEADLLYGDENSADIIINATTCAASSDNTVKAFLTTLNTSLFGTIADGEITDIRIYAPPLVGAIPQVDGGGKTFYAGGQRFGVGTIQVTAQKKVNGNSVAQAVVRIVVAPFPLPGPTGAIQAIGNVGSNGDFNVHWGPVESENAVGLKKTYTATPWFDAYDIAHIERGYDSSSVWQKSTAYIGNTTYPLGAVVRPTDAAKAATPALALHEYVAMQAGSATSGGSEPPWPTTSGGTVPDGSVTWKERPNTMYQIAASDATNYDNHNWLYEVNGKTVDDPWFNIRSWGAVQGIGGGAPHPNAYAANPVPTSWGATHYFQYQTFSARPNYKIVQVPRFDYNFWRTAALSARGQPGVKYLRYVGGNYTDGVTTKSLGSWLATGNGFYFADTTNGLDPQNGGPGTLDTGGGDPCGFKGFVYTNLTAIKTTGCSGSSGYYPEPGEMYRDVGYRGVVETTAGTQVRGDWETDAAGNYVVHGAFNGTWDFQDLDWSNTGHDATGSPGTKNNSFDVYVAQRTVKPDDGTAAYTDWFPVEFYPGCKPGNNSTCGSCNCSEPHEPYLNIRYDGTAGSQTFGWSDPATAGKPKVTDTGLPTGTPVTCTAASVATAAGQANCTSNAYDRDGAVASIGVGVVGVIYNEGAFTSTGNASYFGALVVGQGTSPKGTPDIYFDERLIKGGWPPAGVNFPRVMVSQEQIQ